MDPIDVREERVSTTSGGVPVDGGAPAAAPVAPVAPAYSTAPVAAPAAAPVAAPTTTTSVQTRRAVPSAGSRLSQLIWLIAGVVDVIIALDFVFWAVGTTGRSGFAHYIYRIGGWLAAPFDGIFNSTTVKGVQVLRWTDILAIAIYTIAAWIVTRLIKIVASPRTA